MYNYFIAEDMINQADFLNPFYDKNQFVKDGYLDMDLVMIKFQGKSIMEMNITGEIKNNWHLII